MNPTQPSENWSTGDQLASRIRAYRIHKGVSQRELARLSGVTQNIISRMENCLALPQLETLEKLASSLGLTLAIQVSPSEEDDPLFQELTGVSEKFSQIKDNVLGRTVGIYDDVCRMHDSTWLIEEVERLKDFEDWYRIAESHFPAEHMAINKKWMATKK